MGADAVTVAVIAVNQPAAGTLRDEAVVPLQQGGVLPPRIGPLVGQLVRVGVITMSLGVGQRELGDVDRRQYPRYASQQAHGLPPRIQHRTVTGLMLSSDPPSPKFQVVFLSSLARDACSDSARDT